MNPLNDDQLDELLRQAKARPPEARPGWPARVLAEYRQQRVPMLWRRVMGARLRIPIPAAALAAALLVLLGAALHRPRPPVIEVREVAAPVVRERVADRDCAAAPVVPPTQTAELGFKELRPVREIKPRVVRSIQDDQ